MQITKNQENSAHNFGENYTLESWSSLSKHWLQISLIKNG